MTNGRIIADNIYRVAAEQGLTVRHVCRMAKVSPSLVSDLRYGRQLSLREPTLEKFCTVLNCKAEDLTLPSNKEVKEKPKAKRTEIFTERLIEEMRKRPELKKLMRIAMMATDKQVSATATLLESIVKGTLGDD